MLSVTTPRVPTLLSRRALSAGAELVTAALDGGATFDLSTLRPATETDGYFVGGADNWNGVQIPAVVIPLEEFDAKRMAAELATVYAERLTVSQIAADELPVGFVGVWVHEGSVYVDAVDHVTADHFYYAYELAAARGEHSIYDIARGECIMTESLAAVAV